MPVLARVSITGVLRMSAVVITNSKMGLHRITHSIEYSMMGVWQVGKQLHSQVNSLAEVVLWNRRGLNLLIRNREDFVLH